MNKKSANNLLALSFYKIKQQTYIKEAQQRCSSMPRQPFPCYNFFYIESMLSLFIID